jgi:Tfp pilus assembly pilus retraction ATPase PilT
MIVAQRLIPTVDGKLVLAYEVLTNNYAIQNYIRQNKIFQILHCRSKRSYCKYGFALSSY